MTKNLKLLVFLFVFMAQSTMMLAQGTENEEICLEYRTTPKLNGTVGPTRAPARQNVKRTITAFLDEAAGQLAEKTPAIPGTVSACRNDMRFLIGVMQ